MRFENLRKLVIDENDKAIIRQMDYILNGVEYDNMKGVKDYATTTRWKQYLKGLISLDKLQDFAYRRMKKQYEKKLNETLARIEQIEKILKNAEVVDEDEVDLDKISIGCKVKILDVEFDEEEEFKIVGSSEASSLKGKISNESPVGKALLGAKVGDTVNVETQAGIVQYKVLEIQRAN